MFYEAWNQSGLVGGCRPVEVLAPAVRDIRMYDCSKNYRNEIRCYLDFQSLRKDLELPNIPKYL